MSSASSRWNEMTLEDVPDIEFPEGEDIEAQLDEIWVKLGQFVRPFEPLRSEYRTSKYSKPVIIDIHQLLWSATEAKLGQRGALDWFLLLGLLHIGEGIPNGDEPMRFRVLLHTTSKQVSFVDQPSEEVERVRELELEIRELTKQLRGKSGEPSPPCESPVVAGLPHAVVVNNKPLIASINGDTIVCLQLREPLDPELAPYVISFATGSGKYLVPCSIVEQRFVLFLAPAHPIGSVAITVLCTVGGGVLHKHTKALWLEYKPPTAATLSRHAVNQIAADVPLAPPDPSEVDVANTNTELKSEMERSEIDEMEDPAMSDNMSNATGGEDPHPPLTHELLEMLQEGRVTVPSNMLPTSILLRSRVPGNPARSGSESDVPMAGSGTHPTSAAREDCSMSWFSDEVSSLLHPPSHSQQ